MVKIYHSLLVLIILLIVLLIVGITLKNYSSKGNAFYTEKINIASAVNNKTKKAINQLCENNGVFLFNIGKDNEIYLIFDGSHVNLNGDAPYFSNVKVEVKENTILVYFNEEIKSYAFREYPEQRLVYKITKDKNYDCIKLFRNGEETHFDAIGG